MKSFIIILLVVVTSLSLVILNASKQVTANVVLPKEEKTTLTNSGLWDSINQWRTRSGYTEYLKSDKLCQIADIRLTEIELNFSHEGFSADKFNYVGKIGENLISEVDTNNDALMSWIHSPNHLKLLSDSFTHSCIKTSGTYAVQIFGYY